MGLERRGGTDRKPLQAKGMLAQHTGQLMDLPLHLEQEGGALDHPATGTATEAQAKGAKTALNPTGNGALVALQSHSGPWPVAMPEHVIETL
jgi:hypothetical protein